MSKKEIRKDLERIADDEDREIAVAGAKHQLGTALDNLKEVSEKGENKYNSAEAYRIVMGSSELFMYEDEIQPFNQRYNKLMGIDR